MQRFRSSPWESTCTTPEYAHRRGVRSRACAQRQVEVSTGDVISRSRWIATTRARQRARFPLPLPARRPSRSGGRASMSAGQYLGRDARHALDLRRRSRVDTRVAHPPRSPAATTADHRITRALRAGRRRGRWARRHHGAIPFTTPPPASSTSTCTRRRAPRPNRGVRALAAAIALRPGRRRRRKSRTKRRPCRMTARTPLALTRPATGLTPPNSPFTPEITPLLPAPLDGQVGRPHHHADPPDHRGARAPTRPRRER